MKIALIGYGKMGKEIEKLISKDDEIVLKINESNKNKLNEANLRNADAAIEFTNANSAFDNISFCLKNQIPVVSGTTGWLDKIEQIRDICRDQAGTFFYASNFSLGMNIFMHLNKILASLMNHQKQYEVGIQEIHHIHKLDSPSGTAISLAEDILQIIDRKRSWVVGRETSSDKLSIMSKRKGEIPGTHIICYHSTVDSIEIKHEAFSRTGFAMGALAAAHWVYKKKGCFGMNDLLRL